jgi:hypothetical protein
MEWTPPRRRRGGRRKGERTFVMLGMPALFDLFETRDIDVVLVKLAEIGIRPLVSGYGDRRSFTVYADEFPESMRDRARDAAARDDGWRGFFDRPKE